MPLYEYECRKCGHRLEKIEHYTAKTTRECPNCGGVMERLISAPAIRFKGSGFYETDYAHKSSTQTSGETYSNREAKEHAAPASTSARKDGAGSSASSSSGSSTSKASPAPAAAAPAAASS